MNITEGSKEDLIKMLKEVRMNIFTEEELALFDDPMMNATSSIQ
jgi:hypothetical protein